jgi:hypothetical protein
MHKKYGTAPKRPDTQPRRLNAVNTKRLARLVRKYGRPTIIGAAKEVRVRGPGRPSRGDLPYFEGLWLAQTYEELVEEYRLKGSPKPKTAAPIELYEFEYGDEPDEPGKLDLQKYLKTQKRKLIPRLREWQAVKATLRRMEQSQKKRRPGRE